MATEVLLHHAYMLYKGSERSVILLVNATEDVVGEKYKQIPTR